jgi:hypothetical protein
MSDRRPASISGVRDPIGLKLIGDGKSTSALDPATDSAQSSLDVRFVNNGHALDVRGPGALTRLNGHSQQIRTRQQGQHREIGRIGVAPYAEPSASCPLSPRIA